MASQAIRAIIRRAIRFRALVDADSLPDGRCFTPARRYPTGGVVTAAAAC